MHVRIFLFGMKTMWGSPVFSFAFYLLASILFTNPLTTFIIVSRSGDFFCPVSHCQGRLYILNAFCIWRREQSAE